MAASGDKATKWQPQEEKETIKNQEMGLCITLITLHLFSQTFCLKV